MNTQIDDGPSPYEVLPSPRHTRLLELYSATTDDDLVVYDLRPVSIDDYPEFEALSYTWGSPEEPRKRVHCASTGCDTRVQPRLESALRCLRPSSGTRVLWADALCINQADYAERSIQVQLMCDIFSRAARTIIWFGDDATGDGRRAIPVLERIARELDSLGPPEEFQLVRNREIEFERFDTWVKDVKLTGDNWAAVSRFLEFPWFGRAWIVQELILSKHPVVYLGDMTVDWEIVQRVILPLGEFGAHVNLFPSEATVSVQNTYNAMSMCDFRRAWLTGPDNISSLSLVLSNSKCACLDLRDRLFSSLGLVRSCERAGLSRLIDYRASLETLALGWANVVLPHEGIHRLLAMNNLQPLDERFRSWLPNIFALEQGTMESMRIAMQDEAPSQSSGFTINPDAMTLELTGKLVGTVAELGRLPYRVVSRDTRLADQAAGNPPGLSEMAYIQDLLAEGVNVACGESRPEPMSLEERGIIATLLNVLCLGHMPLFCAAFAIIWQTGIHGNGTDDVVLISGLVWPLIFPFVEQFQRYCEGSINRVLFRTRMGKVGVAPRHAQAGDCICRFDGIDVLYILRPCDDGRYRFIGDCFVDGVDMRRIEEADRPKYTFVLV
ncbi:heterokaryon incompatibility protein-domain-containing protein [Xylariaceae sp. FL1019]|nr:heterokaryon incompatibility protein-domain-containing protein [Xylariaceae sp. FL1019]